MRCRAALSHSVFSVFKTAWLCLSAPVLGVLATGSVGLRLGEMLLLPVSCWCAMPLVSWWKIPSLGTWTRQLVTSSPPDVCRALGGLAASCWRHSLEMPPLSLLAPFWESETCFSQSHEPHCWHHANNAPKRRTEGRWLQHVVVDFVLKSISCFHGGRSRHSIGASDVLESLKFSFVLSPWHGQYLFLVLFWCYIIEKRLGPSNLVLEVKSKRKQSLPVVALEVSKVLVPEKGSCWVLDTMKGEWEVEYVCCWKRSNLFTALIPTETCSLVLAEICSGFQNTPMVLNCFYLFVCTSWYLPVLKIKIIRNQTKLFVVDRVLWNCYKDPEYRKLTWNVYHIFKNIDSVMFYVSVY